MQTETQVVAPVATTENQAPVPTETPEVVKPEPEQTEDSKPPERDKRDETIARMRGRINAKHGEAAAAAERARIAEERLAQLEAKTTPEKIEVDPKEYEREVSRRASEIARIERLNERANSIAKKGHESFDDFGSALDALRSELPLFTQTGPTPVMEALFEMDNPPALIHYLGKNPDVAAELAELSPIRLTRRLDQIERDMKPTRQPSSAPRPLEPVKGEASPSIPDPKTNPAAWREWRNKTAK